MDLKHSPRLVGLHIIVQTASWAADTLQLLGGSRLHVPVLVCVQVHLLAVCLLALHVPHVHHSMYFLCSLCMDRCILVVHVRVLLGWLN